MSYHGEPGELDTSVCQYEASRLWFRGPEQALDKPYVACVGGNETFGRFVQQPYASVLQDRLDQPCVNFGSLFSGAEALSQDGGLLDLVNGADLCILQLPGVLMQANRFYRVHHRRNDRFLEPTPDLLTLYPEVEFTDVHFVRHLLTRLQGFSDARFEVIAQELRLAWGRALGAFLKQVEPPVVLLWLRVNEQDLSDEAETQSSEPVPIHEAMIDLLRAYCADCVELHVQTAGVSNELEDVMFGSLQQPMAEHMLGPATHRSIAEALRKAILDLS